MKQNHMMTAEDVAKELGVSKGHAYKLIRELNLPLHYIAAMPDDVQEEIKEKVIAALTEAGECTPENIERAMSSKIYDLEDLIDIREYVKRMEAEQRKKKTEQKRRGGR